MLAERGGGGLHGLRLAGFLAVDQILRAKGTSQCCIHKSKNCLSHDHYKCQTLKRLMENIEGKGKNGYTVVLKQEFANIKWVMGNHTYRT